MAWIDLLVISYCPYSLCSSGDNQEIYFRCGVWVGPRRNYRRDDFCCGFLSLRYPDTKKPLGHECSYSGAAFTGVFKSDGYFEDFNLCDNYCFLLSHWINGLVYTWLRDWTGTYDLQPFNSIMAFLSHTDDRVLSDGICRFSSTDWGYNQPKTRELSRRKNWTYDWCLAFS